MYRADSVLRVAREIWPDYRIRALCVAVLACACNPAFANGDSKKVVPEASQSDARELDADEDPLARKSQAISSEPDSESQIELYGSIRVRNRRSDSQDVLEDFGSRVGLDGWYETSDRQCVFARYELGFNLLEELELDSLPSRPDQEIGDTLFTRLAYVGAQFGENLVVLGKNFSTYYQVAAFTDRFDSVGGQASGAFNAQTDGGASGTGRADDVLQGRVYLPIFGGRSKQDLLELNVQVQTNQDIPGLDGFEYDRAYGVSSIVRLASDLDLGIAYSRSEIDIANIPVESRNGLDGDLSAWLLGARWYNDDWYLGVTWSKTSNLHTTDALTYFGGEGVELYAQYRIVADIWLLAGLNKLEPDSNQSRAGEYQLDYSVFGARYLFDGFSRMVYLESRINSGRNEDGTVDDDQVILGVRWGFDTKPN